RDGPRLGIATSLLGRSARCGGPSGAVRVDAAMAEIAYCCDRLDADGFALLTNVGGTYLNERLVLGPCPTFDDPGTVGLLQSCRKQRPGFRDLLSLLLVCVRRGNHGVRTIPGDVDMTRLAQRHARISDPTLLVERVEVGCPIGTRGRTCP